MNPCIHSITARPQGSNSARTTLWLAASIVAFGLFSAGCSGPQHVMIRTTPPGAAVRINGVPIGTSPVQWETDFDRGPVAVIQASKSGFFSEEIALDEAARSIHRGLLNVTLLEDEAWKMTSTQLDVTNKFLVVQCDPGISPEDVWQLIVDAVSNRYTHLEQLEPRSGYIRTIPQTRSFQGPKGRYEVRTRFVGNIADRTPFKYKFQIESEQRIGQGNWVRYDRIFKEDAALIEELQHRLTIK